MFLYVLHCVTWPKLLPIPIFFPIPHLFSKNFGRIKRMTNIRYAFTTLVGKVLGNLRQSMQCLVVFANSYWTQVPGRGGLVTLDSLFPIWCWCCDFPMALLCSWDHVAKPNQSRHLFLLPSRAKIDNCGERLTGHCSRNQLRKSAGVET